jgi:UDP-glucuronate 4-epimerase
MKIVVTGGRGFIGSHLVERLKELNYNISTFDIDTVDIRNPNRVEEYFNKERPDITIHLAAKVNVALSQKCPQPYFDTNITGTYNVLEACRLSGCKNVIFASSSSVYGTNSAPFSEWMPLHQTLSPYAATKVMGEQLCSNYSNLYGFNTICLRFFTVYGPRQRPDLAIYKFIDNIYNNKPITMFGNGNTRRDYTFIDDIVEGIIGSIEYIKSSDTPFEVFNLGKSETTTLSSLISTIETALDKKAIIEVKPERSCDMTVTFADITKANDLFGYNPKTSISEGIPKMVEWYKNSCCSLQ